MTGSDAGSGQGVRHVSVYCPTCGWATTIHVDESGEGEAHCDSCECVLGVEASVEVVVA